MRILALDTTGEFGSIALAENGVVLEEVLLHSADGFGHILFEQIARVLDRHGWESKSIDVYAATSGPGSFTGVRIGLAAVKGLAEAAGKRVVAVSNLAAVASFGSAPLRAPFLDARRGEIYGALYDCGLRLVADETVAKFPSWLDSLPAGQIEFLSQQAEVFRTTLAESRFGSCPVTDVPRALARAVAGIAHDRAIRNDTEDPAAIDANYVRRSDAELLWKDER